MIRFGRAAFAGALVVGGALVALTWLAWPRAADPDVRAAYDRLESSPVPVLTLGWVAPRSPQAEVTERGYSLRLNDPDLGDVMIRGCRACSDDAAPGERTWTSGDVRYGVTTAAEASLVDQRVVPLAVARAQLTGNAWDTPLLYLVYLPILAGFVGWAVWSTFARAPAT